VKVDAFDYELPAERIAQAPAARRDASRLLVLDRDTGRVQHLGFTALVDLLQCGDLLVMNDTRVNPARLFGRKASGGRVELLLLEQPDAEGDPDCWECLLQASRRPTPGSEIVFDATLRARVVERRDDRWHIRFEVDRGSLKEQLARLGHTPLPPYIRRSPEARAPQGGVIEGPDDDAERYQTVYAAHPGAVAAPTAGLHFTRSLLERLRDNGVELAWLTLHVGPGTFLPVREEQIERHRMHEERCELPAAVEEAIERTREVGGRVVAVGTTVVRTLEWRAAGRGRVRAGGGRCDLFIYPGFRFRVVDAMITNFHLPRSTLLMLVCAFAGRRQVLDAYHGAVEREYRFYSYGDAMLLR